MPTWPAAVLFDFDGVIVHSEPIHYRSLARILKDEGIALSEAEYFRDFLGVSDQDAFTIVFQSAGRLLTPDYCAGLMAKKSDLVMSAIRRGEVQLLPGVEPFVRRLAGRCGLGICSGAARQEIEAILHAAGMRELFPAIVTPADVTVGKPDPSGYRLTTRLLSEHLGRALTPADCLIVEDSPTVVASVKQAGYPVMAVLTAHGVEKFAAADYIVPSLSTQAVVHAVPPLRWVLEPS